MSYRLPKIPLLTKVIRILGRDEIDKLHREHVGDPRHSRWHTEKNLLESPNRNAIARDAALAITRRLNTEEALRSTQ